jgi:hypothetical protein
MSSESDRGDAVVDQDDDCVSIRALHLPASDADTCHIVIVIVASVDFSNAIGGGLLEDAYYGTADGKGFCVYLDEDRAAKGLPSNNRASVLAAQLGWRDRGDLRLVGDALITGLTPAGDDTDVPVPILTAAQRGGLLPASALRDIAV